MTAPVCPISRSEPPSIRPPALLPGVPAATDLPSLIRTVNIISDILRQISTSLTVNNTFQQPPQQPFDPNLNYPTWDQAETVQVTGYVYHKSRGSGGATEFDREQRAEIRRTNRVRFISVNTDDTVNNLVWSYNKRLDAEMTTAHPPFVESFFERIINVTWSGLAVEFFDGSS